MDPQIEEKSFYKLSKEIFKNIPYKRRKQFWFILCGMIFCAGFETVTLGAIAFYASTINDPGAILESTYMKRIQDITGFTFINDVSGLIIILSVVVIILVLMKNLMLTMLKYVVAKYTLMISRHFGELILNGFLRMPYEWHLTQNSADLVLAVQWSSFFGAYSQLVLNIISDAFLVTLMISAIITLEPLPSLIVLVFLGGTSVIIFFNVRKLIDKSAFRCASSEEAMNRYATRSLHGIKDVKIFGKEIPFLKAFSDEMKTFIRMSAIRDAIIGIPAYLLESVGFLAITSSVCIMIFLTNKSSLNIMGTITLLVVAAWRILPAVKRMLGSINVMRSYLPYLGKEFKYIDEFEGQLQEYQLKTFLERSAGLGKVFKENICLKEVYFSYNGSLSFALQDIGLTIRKATTVGIIGASGGGKSTLVDILIGILAPTKGNVILDGKEMDKSSLAEWIDAVGYVPQTPYIFDGTLAQNVAFGLRDNEIEREKVIECCQMAAIDYLEDLYNGIDSLIGERGVRLSGGQRQRVAIARALYKSPETIIFDEATSSLDTKSEKEIQKTIYSLKRNHTLIIVAHRLSTVEDCDYIVWMEKGKVNKVGNSKDILREYSKGDDIDNSDYENK